MVTTGHAPLHRTRSRSTLGWESVEGKGCCWLWNEAHSLVLMPAGADGWCSCFAAQPIKRRARERSICSSSEPLLRIAWYGAWCHECLHVYTLSDSVPYYNCKRPAQSLSGKACTASTVGQGSGYLQRSKRPHRSRPQASSVCVSSMRNPLSSRSNVEEESCCWSVSCHYLLPSSASISRIASGLTP